MHLYSLNLASKINNHQCVTLVGIQPLRCTCFGVGEKPPHWHFIKNHGFRRHVTHGYLLMWAGHCKYVVSHLATAKHKHKHTLHIFKFILAVISPGKYFAHLASGPSYFVCLVDSSKLGQEVFNVLCSTVLYFNTSGVGQSLVPVPPNQSSGLHCQEALQLHMTSAVRLPASQHSSDPAKTVTAQTIIYNTCDQLQLSAVANYSRNSRKHPTFTMS